MGSVSDIRLRDRPISSPKPIPEMAAIRNPARNLPSDGSKCSAKPVPNQSVRKVLRMLANEGKYKEVLPALATHQSTNKSTGNQLRSSTLCNSPRSLGCTTVVMLSPHEPRDARTTLAFQAF